MSQLKIIAVAIPALGALILGLADRLGYSPRVEAPDDATTATTGYRRIAWLAASLTLATVLCAALVDRSVGTRGVPGADGIGFSYSLLTSAAWLAVILTARQCDRRHTRLLYGLLLLLESAFLGLFLADSVLVLCLFWGSSSWILSLLIAGWGGSERDRAARRFLCFNLAADMLVTVALLGAVVAGARMSAAMTGSNRELSYSISQLTHEIPKMTSENIEGQEYWNHARPWLLAALIAGLLVKAPLFPFQSWFSRALTEAPLCGALALSGASLGISTYALVRIAGPLSGAGDLGAWSGILMRLCVFSALYQSLLALAHSDLKKIAVAVSLSEASIALAAFFSTHPAGSTAAVLLSLAGGLGATLWLFVVGCLERRFEPQEMPVVSGIWRVVPQLSCALLVALFSLAGIPGLGGFAGFFAALATVMEADWTSAFFAIVAVLVFGWALFWLVERMIFGPPGLSRPADLSRAELAVAVTLLAGIVLIGIRPQIVIDLINTSLRVGSFSP